MTTRQPRPPRRPITITPEPTTTVHAVHPDQVMAELHLESNPRNLPLGPFLEDRMIARGYNQAELARQMNAAGSPVRQQTISAWIMGKYPPSSKYHAVLSRLLKVPLTDLVLIIESARRQQEGSRVSRVNQRDRDLREARDKAKLAESMVFVLKSELDELRRRMDQVDGSGNTSSTSTRNTRQKKG